jgi:fatty acid desaturase
MQRSQWLASAGYLSVFIMPLLLALGAWFDTPYLAIGVALLVFALLRWLFGSYRPIHDLVWHERIATLLHRLPLFYVVALVASMVIVVHSIGSKHAFSGVDLLGVGLSLWITLLFGLCAAHELVHRRSKWERAAGHVLSGLVGYPLLVFEHRVHHGSMGDTATAEWPTTEESVWRFSARRLRRIVGDLWANVRASVRARDGQHSLRGSKLAGATTLLTAATFFFAAGVPGAATYIACALGVAFAMQIITYLQHWGLADQHFTSADAQPLTWEEDCQFQAWVTLHISFHMAHHRAAGQPYYRLGMVEGSPRLPAGYIVLMVLCLFPFAWRRAMLPTLRAWHRDPAAAPPPGRRLTCFQYGSGRA